MDSLSELNRAVLRLRDWRAGLEEFRRRALSVSGGEELARAAEGVEKTLTEIERKLTEPRMETGGDAFHYPTRLDNKLAVLIGVVANSDRAPTEPARQVFDDLWGRAKEELARLEAVRTGALSELNRKAVESGVPAIAAPER